MPSTVMLADVRCLLRAYLSNSAGYGPHRFVLCSDHHASSLLAASVPMGTPAGSLMMTYSNRNHLRLRYEHTSCSCLGQVLTTTSTCRDINYLCASRCAGISWRATALTAINVDTLTLSLQQLLPPHLSGGTSSILLKHNLSGILPDTSSGRVHSTCCLRCSNQLYVGHAVITTSLPALPRMPQ